MFLMYQHHVVSQATWDTTTWLVRLKSVYFILYEDEGTVQLRPLSCGHVLVQHGPLLC